MSRTRKRRPTQLGRNPVVPAGIRPLKQGDIHPKVKFVLVRSHLVGESDETESGTFAGRPYLMWGSPVVDVFKAGARERRWLSDMGIVPYQGAWTGSCFTVRPSAAQPALRALRQSTPRIMAMPQNRDPWPLQDSIYDGMDYGPYRDAPRSAYENAEFHRLLTSLLEGTRFNSH